MSSEIEITTKFCHPYINYGGDGCNDVILKVPQSEVAKLQVMEHSKGETAGIEYYPEFFAVSFSITLLFWLVAKFGWMIIETIKRA